MQWTAKLGCMQTIVRQCQQFMAIAHQFWTATETALLSCTDKLQCDAWEVPGTVILVAIPGSQLT